MTADELDEVITELLDRVSGLESEVSWLRSVLSAVRAEGSL